MPTVGEKGRVTDLSKISLVSDNVKSVNTIGSL